MITTIPIGIVQDITPAIVAIKTIVTRQPFWVISAGGKIFQVANKNIDIKAMTVFGERSRLRMFISY